MRLEEITLNKDIESKRKAIRDNLGRQVLLNDSHEKWCHGVLLGEDCKDVLYSIKIADIRELKSLYYHDLNQLLIILLNLYALPCFNKPK